jgi:hypothetical protein
MTGLWRVLHLKIGSVTQMRFANGAQRAIQRMYCQRQVGNHYDIAPVAAWPVPMSCIGRTPEFLSNERDSDSDSDSTSANEKQQYNQV